MLRRPGTAALCALAVVPLLVAGGCGTNARSTQQPRSSEEAAREGLAVDVAGLDYTVLITRQLNPRDVEDADYYAGPDHGPNELLYGVFIRVCNDSEEGSSVAARDFRVTDTRGDEFEPLEPEVVESPFSYEPRRLGPKECIPAPDSVAGGGPTNGALLVFKFPKEVIENRPLELEVLPPSSFGGLDEEQVGKIDLDL